jgi:hypothetical protein
MLGSSPVDRTHRARIINLSSFPAIGELVYTSPLCTQLYILKARLGYQNPAKKARKKSEK